MEEDTTSQCPKCGERYTSSSPLACASCGALRRGRLRLDPRTPLESALLIHLGAASLTGLAVFGYLAKRAPSPPPWPAEATPWVVGGVALWLLVAAGLYLTTDCRYVLDLDGGHLEYLRDAPLLMRLPVRYTVCRLDEVHSVGVQVNHRSHRHGSHWMYRVALVLRDGTVFPVSEWWSETPRTPNRIAGELGEHLRVPVFLGEPELDLAATWEDGKLVVTQVPWQRRLDARGVLVIVGLVAALAAALLAIVGA